MNTNTQSKLTFVLLPLYMVVCYLNYISITGTYSYTVSLFKFIVFRSNNYTYYSCTCLFIYSLLYTFILIPFLVYTIPYCIRSLLLVSFRCSAHLTCGAGCDFESPGTIHHSTCSVQIILPTGSNDLSCFSDCW